jgi:phosphatidylglycerol:prolipoprotein diacylglycerol transferase
MGAGENSRCFLAPVACFVCAARVLAVYVHNLDPVALPLHGAVAIRWYGLAYLFGFVAGFFLLRRLATRGLWVLGPEKVGDFIAAAALFGVFLGGRLGYLFFYQLPAAGWEGFARDPLQVLRVWEGGMASHGGILGLMIFTWVYARKHKVSWTGLGDGLCVVAPLGLLFGRIANFINGELYGRVCGSLPWAVKFPLSLPEESPEAQRAAWDACIAADPALAGGSLDSLIAAVRKSPEVARALGEHLSSRHPSQLYEALLEGLLLFLILFGVRLRHRNVPHGLLTGLFFGLYAVFRIIGEQFREPDAAMVGWLTKGQFFSLFMLVIAAAFLFHALRRVRSSPGS